MSNTAAMRASSMLVSAGLLGGIVVLALTFSISLPPTISFVDLNPITAEREPEPPPPVLRTQPNPPPTEQTEDAEPTDAPFPLTTVINTDPVGPISFGDPSPEITNPHWLSRPRNLQQYYPRRALTRGVEGVVVLDCLV